MLIFLSACCTFTFVDMLMNLVFALLRASISFETYFLQVISLTWTIILYMFYCH